MGTTQEVLCFASLIGTFYGLISVMGYSSVSFILSLIKYYGATEAEIIKSLRKVLSFVLFPKALNWKYIVGFIAVLVSTAYTFYLKGVCLSDARCFEAAAEGEINKPRAACRGG